MNYTALMDFLSACGTAAVLINNDNTMIAVNDYADSLLQGGGQMPGQKLPMLLWPSVRLLRENPAPSPYVRLGFGRYVRCAALLSHPLLPGDTRLLILQDASRDFALDMVSGALNEVHEAVVICDEEDRMYFCNRAALDTDDLVMGHIEGERIEEVYENEDASPLSIPLARKTRTPSLNHRQFYHTKSGQRRETIANFFPVLQGDEAIGAFSVVEDWDTASSLQRKVIDLQDRLLDYGQREDSRRESVLHASHRFADLVQQSAVARNTVKQCREAAATDRPVLLYGEPGTAKHFLAQGIHAASARKNGPFLHFDCASLPHALLDAMLFGTVRGAFPEAEEKRGLLEQADGGTLYLSELESMDLALQRKLLRVLQSGVFSRSGSTDELPLHVRFVLSASLSPEKAIEDKKLDPSLFSFLQHTCIMTPPLRNRRADIIPLTMEFVNACNRKYGRHVVTVSDNIFLLFKKYRWPGNIKELKQAIDHAVRTMPEEAEILTTEYLPARITHKKPAAAAAITAPAASADTVLVSRPADSEALKDTVTELRRQSIYQILLKNGGNITKAAAEMGLSRQNLQYHIRQCGIDLAEIRAARKK